MVVLRWGRRLRDGTVQAGTTESCSDVVDVSFIAVTDEGVLLHSKESELLFSLSLHELDFLPLLLLGFLLYLEKVRIRIHDGQVDNQKDQMCGLDKAVKPEA